MGSFSVWIVGLILLLTASPVVAHNQVGGRLGTGEDFNGVSGAYVANRENLDLALFGDFFLSSTAFTTLEMDHVAAKTTTPIPILCDLEVLSDGNNATVEDNDLDETIVDATVTPSGKVPNGLWDDGGIGGACHTRNYLTDSYNSPGCPETSSVASDAVSGSQVWIAAACDWMTTIGGAATLNVAANCAVTDGVRNGLADEPGALVGCANPVLGCVTSLIPCATGSVSFCGSDGLLDAMSFGRGGDGALYPNSAFVDSGCAAADATAAMLVFHRVDVVIPANPLDGELPGVPTLGLTEATAGWIAVKTTGQSTFSYDLQGGKEKGGKVPSGATSWTMSNDFGKVEVTFFDENNQALDGETVNGFGTAGGAVPEGAVTWQIINQGTGRARGVLEFQ